MEILLIDDEELTLEVNEMEILQADVVFLAIEMM